MERGRKMRAVISSRYGTPDILQITTVPRPIPKSNEVLIKVHATTVNRTDCGFLSGTPLFVRLFIGLTHPRNTVLGNEFAGQIESVGDAVTLFKPGEKVFGFNDKSFGAHAEYLVMPEEGSLATIPDKMSYTEAAPITEGAHYALCDIRAAKIKQGQNVLINGATGGIGSAAVQIVKYYGANVTAVCDTKHINLVRSLGADVVIDYTREDFTQLDQKFDFVFDSVGKSSYGKCKPLLKPGGIYISTELGPMNENPFLAMLTPMSGGKKVLFPIPTINKEDVLLLKTMIEEGKYKPVIDDRSYPLDKIADAYRYVGLGQKTGNVVIRVTNQ
jgi:NADPH:quinone reductase-like Zn-dependent oxidoreductase